MSPRKASLRGASALMPEREQDGAVKRRQGERMRLLTFLLRVQRDRDGRPVKGARVKDRTTAERALAATQREIDEGRVGIAKPLNITFSDWADEFERILDARIASGELHPRTKGSYTSTLNRGREAFGSLYLREIGNPELRRLTEPLANLKPASRLRYLRELRPASRSLSVTVTSM